MSFKDATSVYAKTPKFIPFIDFEPTLLSWYHIFGKTVGGESEYMILDAIGENGLYLKNSLIVSFCSSILTITLGVMAAYALTRFKFKRWNNDNIFYIVSTYVSPSGTCHAFFLVISFCGTVR